jgi:hypothetical protein
MSSMGFSRDSISKLVEMLDESSSVSSIDEKTYLELSNAAKYLYEKAGPGGENPVYSMGTQTHPRSVAVARSLDEEFAAVAAAVPSAASNSIPRLNINHKVNALKKKLNNLGIEEFEIQGRRTRTAYVKYLVDKCKENGVTEREIKRIYQEEKMLGEINLEDNLVDMFIASEAHLAQQNMRMLWNNVF